MSGKLIKKTFVITLIFAFFMGGAVLAQGEGDYEIKLDGQVLEVDATIEDGRTYVDSAALEEVTGYEVDEHPEVALRAFFEGQGAIVTWDGKTNTIRIYDEVDDYTAAELVASSSEVMKAKNSMQMTSIGTIDFSLEVPEKELSIPKTSNNFAMEGSFSYDPFEMYMEQELEGDAVEFFAQGISSVSQEIAFADGVSYQRYPQLTEAWMAHEYDEAELDQVMELMEMMVHMDVHMFLLGAEGYGAVIEYGEDEVINDTDYKVVNISLDDEVLQDIVNDMVADEELANISEDLLAELSFDLEYEYKINSENLYAEYLNEEVELDFSMDADDISELVGEEFEGEINLYLNAVSETENYGFGEPVELPEMEEVETIETIETIETLDLE